ncbi:MAG: hypothetical protein FJX23_06445 [Alphaproteobacteria bacterium]|nr:hypothetical protein [Alphaproteobacteria bacterium]
MADTPSKQDLYDEAAMQDAIAAKKATGGLIEANPQDAPAPVKSDFATRRASPAKDLPPQPTAEDKAFSFVEQQLARRAAPATDKGQSR